MGETVSKGGSSLSTGQEVYGIFNGPSGCFVSGGTIVGMDGDGFEVQYRVEPYARRHAYVDIGEKVFTDRESAERGSENADIGRREREREDFAEQNTRPFEKI